MAYKIYLHNRVNKYIRKLKDRHLKEEINDAIFDQIAVDPYTVGEQKRGDLSNFYAYKLRFKGVQYRIAYTSDDEGNLIIIALAGTRENCYEELKRIINKINKRKSTGLTS